MEKEVKITPKMEMAIKAIQNFEEGAFAREVLDYLNENEFRKKERSVKKYNMLAYKKLIFDYYPQFREGKFEGVIKSVNKQEKMYNLQLK